MANPVNDLVSCSVHLESKDYVIAFVQYRPYDNLRLKSIFVGKPAVTET